MSLPRTYIRNQKGFTLVEILVVMAILASLLSMGLFFDFAFYRHTSFGTDVDTFTAVLRRARAKAINNIDASEHGVYVSVDKFILFEGSSYPTATATEEISRNTGMTFSGIPVNGIVFSRLSGDSGFEGDITITGFEKTKVITINNEGLIND